MRPTHRFIVLLMILTCCTARRVHRRVQAAGTVCRAFQASCNPSRASLPPYEWGNFRFPDAAETSRASASIIQRLKDRKKQVLLHIGPNELSLDEARLYRDLLSIAEGNDPRLVFVEPLPRSWPKLRKRMRYATGSNRSGEIIPKAVCPSSVGPQTSHPTLYTFSQRLLHDFPSIPSEMFGDLSTLSLRQLLDSIPRFQQARRMPKLSDAEWLSSTYIQQIPVECPTAALLLSELGIEPRNIVMLTIDTEGFDTLLVPDFLELANFQPALLEFEYVNQREADNVTFALVLG